ncbi:MAG TPA: GntR family transcriptional regulator [Ramlibacter sp.]|nr:GntR family transcriptional regulator [Ramlibacter sp.]
MIVKKRSVAARPTRKPRVTLSSDDIYDRVKEMAARFEFRPNERINEIELSKALNVSRTPLREVLNQLMVEGFLTREQNRGFIARALNPQEILHLYEFRRSVEISIATLACERGTDEEIAGLAAFSKEAAKASKANDAARMVALDEEFHLALARMARNPEYERVLRNINARIHYIRWIDMRQRHVYTQNEHDQIVAAMKKRSVTEVRKLLEQHINRRLDQIVEAVKAGYAEIYTRVPN